MIEASAWGFRHPDLTGSLNWFEDLSAFEGRDLSGLQTSEPLIFAAVIALLIFNLGAATWYSARLLRRFIPVTNVLLTLPDTVLRLVLIAVCIALGLWLGPGGAALGWHTDRIVEDILMGVGAAVLLAPVFIWAGNMAVRRWGPEAYDNRLLRAIVPANRGEWLGVALALLPAAVLEELLFRSLPLGGLGWIASPWVLMWPLSLLFGLMHASQGYWGLAGTALMGLLFSALFLYTGSIWAPVTAHWLLNVTEVTLAQRQGLLPLRADLEDGPTAPLT